LVDDDDDDDNVWARRIVMVVVGAKRISVERTLPQKNKMQIIRET